MAEARKRIRVTNTTDADVLLPPVSGKKHKNADGTPGRDWPALRILPGGYNVDTEYLEAIRGPKATPGAFKAYQQLTTVPVGAKERPALVVSEDPKAAKVKEGPEPPKSLRAYGEDQAKIIVQNIDDVDALRLWLKNEGRTEVKEAIEKQLASLRG